MNLSYAGSSRLKTRDTEPEIIRWHNVLNGLMCIFVLVDLVDNIFIRQCSIKCNTMKYRDKNEIIAQILESANGNRVRLTKIMYDVYISHTVTKEYLTLLIERGLIQYLDGERTFKTTEKGMNFLRIYSKAQELNPIITKFSNRKEI